MQELIYATYIRTIIYYRFGRLLDVRPCGKKSILIMSYSRNFFFLIELSINHWYRSLDYDKNEFDIYEP